MKLLPSRQLNQKQIDTGLHFIVKEGVAAEAMVTLTSSTFLVAMALYMGATNLQIGMLAALPTFTNVFQLLSIWLVQRYRNRRLICVICCICARLPLLAIGCLPFLCSKSTSLPVLMILLFFHYLFGAVSGASWQSWMKDLVPGKILGSYFSNRTRTIQIVSVTLSLALALTIDHLKLSYPQYELQIYTAMFFTGGIIGLSGVYLLSRAPEPVTTLTNGNIFKLIARPLRDKNFRNLLTFHSCWTFALNLANPFFAVYMMKTLGLPLSYIIGLGILSQLSSICLLKIWGAYTDRYSNKTILRICAPIYVCCIFAWSFTGTNYLATSILIIGIHLFSGMSMAGINLAIGNMAIKLAPKSEAIVYIATRNIVIAIFGAIAPLAGGLMADFFSTHQLVWNIEWSGPEGVQQFSIIKWTNLTFFFVIAALLSLLSLRLLSKVKEEGEIDRSEAAVFMRHHFVKGWKKKVDLKTIIIRVYQPVLFPMLIKKITAYLPWTTRRAA